MALLDGRKALVTGASRGIGADIARGLAAHGAAVAVAARSDEASPDPRLPGTIRTVAAEIRSAGGTAVPVPLDVRSPESITRAVERTVAELGGLDILVNNAAVLVPGTLESVQDRHIDLIWQLDLRGPVLLCKAAVEHMKESGGDIINISSGAADAPRTRSLRQPAVGRAVLRDGQGGAGAHHPGYGDGAAAVRNRLQRADAALPDQDARPLVRAEHARQSADGVR